MRGRKPDAHAVRREKDKAEIIPATTTALVEGAGIEPPLSITMHQHMTELWTSMVGRGIAYQQQDVPIIEQLVFNLEMVEQCRQHIMGPDGEMRIMCPVGEPDPDTGEYLKYAPNPYIKQMRAATTESLKLADQLGLTPLARARLGLTQAAGKAVTLSIAESIDAALGKRS